MPATIDQIRIDGLTLEEYCNDPDRVRADAIAAGVKGSPYEHHQTRGGRFTGKVTIRHRDLNNLDLWNFAKQKYQASL